MYAGVPAKRIMSIDEYYEKRERAQFNEAKKLAVEYFDRYGKRPGKEVFHEYFMLFETEMCIRDSRGSDVAPLP